MLIKSFFKVILFSLIFIGCGTDSRGGKFTGTILDDTEIEEINEIEQIESSEPTLKTGVFLDSSVSGLKYKTTLGVEGTTNSIGEYNYYNDDLIEFFVGEVSLGEVEAKELITVDDLPYPIQVAQFLQTIDYDNFTENGIKIDEVLHLNVLLKKFKVKDENSSLFAKRLDIKYFDDSQRNNIFMEKVLTASRIPSRKIVSDITASQHKDKSKRLQNIKNNNIKLYHDITNIEVNNTLEINATDINSSTILFTTLKPRLIYSFYKNGYRNNLKLQAQIEELMDSSDELNKKYRDNYLNLTNMIIEMLLYTESSTKDTKREIIDNLKNISTQNSKIVDVAKECLSTLSLEDNNRSREAQKIMDCIEPNIKESSNQFTLNIQNSPTKAKEREVAIAYLDLYLSCDPEDENSILKKFENNTTMDSRLWYATTHTEIDSNSSSLLYEGAKSIINDYITKMSKLAESVSKGLPQDSFLNKEGVEDMKKISISAKPIKIEYWENNTILWTAIDINNRTGADVNITSLEPKIIIENREIPIPNSHLYTVLEQSYSRANSAVNMLTPIFIDDTTLLKEKNKLSIEIYYRANDETFQTDSKIVVDFDLNEMESEKKVKKFNKNKISLSKSMGIVEEKQKLYLPTVNLGFNILNRDNVKWIIRPNDIRIKRDNEGKLYVYPSLKPENSYETKFFEVSNKLDPYSMSTTFVLNIIRKKPKVIKEEIDPNSFPITIEYIAEHPTNKLVSEDCKTKKWRVWRNLKFALRNKISTEENIMNSIQGCVDIQKLVEEEDYEYRDAVVNIVQNNRSMFR